MHIAHGPNRKIFRSFSEMKGYDGYLIGKLSCVCLKQDSYGNRGKISKTVEKEDPEREAWKHLDGEEASGIVRIRKQRRNFAVLELQEEKYLCTITLLRPEQVVSHAKLDNMITRKPEMEKRTVVSDYVIARHSFTVTEILEFVEFVRDTNGIHQTAEPVVPGLLMAEWFCAVLQSVDWEAFEMRFHVPVFAGQALCIGKKAEKYICYEEKTGQVFWIASVKGIGTNQCEEYF